MPRAPLPGKARSFKLNADMTRMTPIRSSQMLSSWLVAALEIKTLERAPQPQHARTLQSSQTLRWTPQSRNHPDEE
jgi:hypothetical protein